jgi:alpha-L-fucosidase
MCDEDERLTEIVPSRRQFEFQQLEFYAFIHFTVNTFTGKEWGDGTESESLFDLKDFHADQIAAAVKSAGMRGLILTCKHIDGFCLWPSKFTSHTIAESPYKNGKGDIVAEMSAACQNTGLRFGVYIAPWDRNNSAYGKGKEYDDFFVNQLTELLTGYGKIFSVWFDGACGEGKDGRHQMYDWNRYYSIIRTLQPEACINVCGPDIRWCGNESGDTRESEWSVVPKRAMDTEKIGENSQQNDDEIFRKRKVSASDRDLGSRKVLKNERELVWYPAEVDTSIRPGWFYHPEEDNRLRSVDELFDIYVKSVGGNSMLLLNVPPTKDGLIHPNDVKTLNNLGDLIRKSFAHNLLLQAQISADSSKDGFGISNVLSDDYSTYFRTSSGIRSCKINITFKEVKRISYIVLKENILLSQRIECFSVTASNGNIVYHGTVVGYKKIIRLNTPIEANKLTISIEDSRVFPTLSFIGVY